MTDSARVVRWSADYKPFGEATIDQAVTTITNNLRGMGQYFDVETGLIFNYFRVLNAATGRYNEADPIGTRYGTNHLYVYSQNNPLRYIDPLGLLSYDDIKSLVASNNLSGQSNQLVICTAWKESGFNPGAQSGGSSARGLMQVTKAAAKDTGYDYNMLYDASYNLAAGSKYLGLRIKWAGGNVTNGLNGYGTGPGYANDILQCEKCLKDTPCQSQKCLDMIHK